MLDDPNKTNNDKNNFDSNDNPFNNSNNCFRYDINRKIDFDI